MTINFISNTTADHYTVYYEDPSCYSVHMHTHTQQYYLTCYCLATCLLTYNWHLCITQRPVSCFNGTPQMCVLPYMELHSANSANMQPGILLPYTW